MSGFCSSHQGHDPECPRCQAIPLTPEKAAYYEGYEARLRHMLANCWTPVENCVLNVFTTLEGAARSQADKSPELVRALEAIDTLRALKRGMWGRDLKQ